MNSHCASNQHSFIVPLPLPLHLSPLTFPQFSTQDTCLWLLNNLKSILQKPFLWTVRASLRASLDPAVWPVMSSWTATMQLWIANCVSEVQSPTTWSELHKWGPESVCFCSTGEPTVWEEGGSVACLHRPVKFKLQGSKRFLPWSQHLRPLRKVVLNRMRMPASSGLDPSVRDPFGPSL